MTGKVKLQNQAFDWNPLTRCSNELPLSNCLGDSPCRVYTSPSDNASICLLLLEIAISITGFSGVPMVDSPKIQEATLKDPQPLRWCSSPRATPCSLGEFVTPTKRKHPKELKCLIGYQVFWDVTFVFWRCFQVLPRINRSILEMLPFVEIGSWMVCFFLRRPDMSGGKYRRSNSATSDEKLGRFTQEYCDILYIA